MSARAAAVALWAAGIFTALAGSAGAQAIHVQTRVEPDRAVLHSQVELRVEVTHPDWARPRWDPGAFEGMRPERLSTRVERPEGGPADVQTTVFRRALFPTRIGELRIRPSTVRYEEPDGAERAVVAPGARLHVSPLPDLGRPEEFQGLVGDVTVSAELLRASIAKGESARLFVEVYGEANVWGLEPPRLAERIGPDVEVFPSRGRIHVGEHRGRISARHTFVWDLVPAEEGRYEIPSISIPYFHPQTGTYRSAASQPIGLEVTRERPGPARGPREVPPRRTPSPLVIALVAGAVGVALAGAAVFLAGWARRGAERLRAAPRPSPQAALARARQGIGTEAFPGLLARAIRVGLAARHRLDTRGLTTDEIAARIHDPEGLALLAALDGIRFGRDPRTAESLLVPVTRYLQSTRG